MANALVQMQKLAGKTQVQLQKMVNDANKLQAEYNSSEAQKSRDWQTEMSKTAHQMEVQDLKKAGLNPVLSAGGSGAQSYTTSSASIQPESGASSLSGVQSAQLSAIGSMESSRISANAQKAAAAQTAAAMKSAAATAAAAQMYAANKGYEKAKYQADKAYSASKYNADVQKQIAGINKGKTWAGLVDKYLEGAGLGSAAANSIRSRFVNPIKNFYKDFTSNPQKFFENKGVINPSNFKLNGTGAAKVNAFLKGLGLTANERNRKLAINAFVFKKQSAANSIFSMYASNRWQHGNKSTNSRSIRHIRR